MIAGRTIDFRTDQGRTVDVIVTAKNGDETTYRFDRQLRELGETLIVFGLAIVDQAAKAQNLAGALIPMVDLDLLLGPNGELELNMSVSGQPLHIGFGPNSARAVYEALGRVISGQTRAPTKVH